MTEANASPATAWPLVSVIVPVFEAAVFLGEALASIAAQNYAPLEVLVVDDGSTDHPERVVARVGLRARFLTQANAGPAAARNHGLRESTGSLIAFLDADDRWTPGALQALVRNAVDFPGVEMIHGHLQNYRVEPGGNGGEERILLGKPRLSFNVGSGLFRREIFDRIGPFDENLRTSEDVDLFVRIKEAGFRRLVIPEVTLLYRRGQGGIMESLPPEVRTSTHHHRWLHILARSMKRRLAEDKARKPAPPREPRPQG